MSIDLIMRVLHIITAAAWFGSIVFINAVILPFLKKTNGESRNKIIQNVLPKGSKLVSHLSIIVVLTGIHLVVSLSDANLTNLLSGRWGLSILFGGTIGIILSIYHFIAAKNLNKKLTVVSENGSDTINEYYKKYRRLNLIVFTMITAVLILMVNAVRGLY